jgi:hypothetical protein
MTCSSDILVTPLDQFNDKPGKDPKWEDKTGKTEQWEKLGVWFGVRIVSMRLDSQAVDGDDIWVCR